MGKHVCPICEDVYAYRGELTLAVGGFSDAYEAWYCPECGYSFVGTAEVQQVVKIVAAPKNTAATPHVSFVKAQEGPVVRRS